MNATRWLALLIVASLLSVAGCRRKAVDFIEPGMAALRDAGLAVDGFQAVDARRFGALACREGHVGAFDALVCDYGTPESWVRGKKAAEDWIGAALTGTWAARDRLLLVVADRARADPSGKQLSQIVRAFSGRK
jgi:hypothetical protein